VIALVVDIFKYIRAQFVLFGFKTKRIHLKVCLVTPGKMIMVFNLMQSITLDTPKALEMTRKGGMFLLLAVLAL